MSKLGHFAAACAAALVGFAASAAEMIVLPPDYRQLSSITSTGTQWIDTREVPGPTIGVTMDFSTGPLVEMAFFGMGWGGSCYMFCEQSNYLKFYGGGTNIRAFESDTDYLLTVTPTSGENGNVVLTKAGEAASAPVSVSLAYTGTKTLGLFACAGGSKPASFTLRRFTMTGNGTVLRDFIPCRELVGDERIGLFDLVGQEFFPNAGKNAFVPGEDVTYCDKLTVVGTPGNFGSVTPAYGVKAGLSPNDTVTCSAVAPLPLGKTVYTCEGYVVWACDAEGVWHETSRRTGSSFTYTHPDAPYGGKVEWLWGLSENDALPLVTSVTCDGTGGDTLVVRGTLDSFAGADCTLRVVVEDQETGVKGVWEGVDGAVRTATGAFELTLFESDPSAARHLSCGSAYSVTVEATSGGLTSRSETVGVQMAAGATFKTNKLDINRRTATVTAALSALGANGSAEVSLWAGETNDPTTFEQVEPSVAIADTANYTIVHDFPALEHVYYWQLRAVSTARGGTSAATNATAVASTTTSDTATYTWKKIGSSWNGSLTDRDRWTCSAGEDRLDWPVATKCKLEFPAGVVARVEVPASTSCGTITLCADSDVTFVAPADGERPQLSPGGLTASSRSKLTVDHVDFELNATMTMASEMRLALKNGAYAFAKEFQCYAGGQFIGLSDKSELSASVCRLGGCKVEIDDSTLTVRADCYFGDSLAGGSMLFKGANPQLVSSVSASKYWAPNIADSTFDFDFLIPAGGYASVPVVGLANPRAFGTPNGAKANSVLRFNVLDDSPAAQVDAALDQPLVQWTKGVDATYVRGGHLPIGTGNAAFDIGQTDATLLSVGFTGSAGKLIVTASPFEYGEPSSGYGAVTGLAPADVRTFTFPAYTNQAEATACRATGWTVTAFDPATGGYTTPVATGDGDTCGYVHPDPAVATKLEWQLEISYLVTAAAEGGGSVSPSEQWVVAGRTATVASSVGDGRRVACWTSEAMPYSVGGTTLVVRVNGPMAVTAHVGSEIHVAAKGGDGNDDTGDGTSANPYATIAKGVERAGSGYATVLLAPGTHEVAEAIALANPVVIASETGRAEDVTIVPTAPIRIFRLSHPAARVERVSFNYTAKSGGDNQSFGGSDVYVDAGVVEGCVLYGYNNSQRAGGSVAYLTGAQSLMTGCVISNNAVTAASMNGDRCAGLNLAADARAENCLIVGNSTTKSKNNEAAGGVYLTGGVLANSTVIGNKSVGCGGVRATGGTVVNCVIVDNQSTAKDLSYDNFYPDTDSRFVSCAFDKATASGEGCFLVADAASCFAQYAVGDYTPVNGGPLVDAGRSDAVFSVTDFAGIRRVIGASVDVGAFEFDSDVFGVALRPLVSTGFAPAEFTVVAEVSGVESTDGLTFAWWLDGVRQDCTTASFTTELPLGAHSYKVEVTKDGVGTVADEKADLVLVVPRVMKVKDGNPNAAYPYDTEANAAPDVQTALAATISGGIVELVRGNHQLNAKLTIDKAVTVRGETGNPADVVIKSSTVPAMVCLAHPDARLEAVTISHLMTGNPGDGALPDGAALQISAPGGTADNCIVRDYKGSNRYSGSAVGLVGPMALLTRSVISNCVLNTGSSASCIALVISGGARAENCVITGNDAVKSSSTEAAGGVRVTDGHLVNCLVKDNKSPIVGGVVVKAGEVANTVIVDNSSTAKDATYDNILPGSDGFFSHCASDKALIAGAGCVFESDPAAFFTLYSAGDYRPLNGGKLVDAGVSSAVESATDFGGATRVMGEAVDIGLYEFDPNVFGVSLRASVNSTFAPATVTVTAETSGVGDGDVLAYAWTVDGVASEETGAAITLDLQPGAHSFGVTVTRGGDSVSDEKEDLVKVVPQVMKVKDGNPNAAFPYDTVENAASDVQTALAATIPGGIVELEKGSHQLLSMLTINKAVTVRGATGNPADVVVSPRDVNAVNMFCLSATDARLESLTVRHDYTAYLGDGLLGEGACVKVTDAGGTVENCIVCGYTGPNRYAGSAVYLTGEEALLSRCVISNCTYQNNSGSCSALKLANGAKAVSCLIAENRTPSSKSTECAGAAYVNGGHLVNCTVISNRASAVGGVTVKSGEVVNCAFIGNVSTAMDETYSSILPGTDDFFSHCAFDDATTGGEKCFRLLDPPASFRRWEKQDYRPRLSSPLVDAGVVLPWMTDGMVDLYGTPRVRCKRPDVGCAECRSVGFVLQVR